MKLARRLIAAALVVTALPGIAGAHTPGLSVSPSSVNLGPVLVGDPDCNLSVSLDGCETAVLVVTNTGGASVLPGSQSVCRTIVVNPDSCNGGTWGSVTTDVPAFTCGGVIEPGETCQITIVGLPSVTGVNRGFYVMADQSGEFILVVPVEVFGTVSCFGRPATIVGSQADERIEGTQGDDVIAGLGGEDVVFGGDGDDLICGNTGGDTIDGGSGDDRMSGGPDRDFITGVDGDDVLLGGAGDDSLNFGDEEDGDDNVIGGAGNDDLHAGIGRDRLSGNTGDDFLAEGEVDAPLEDLFFGGVGADTCFPGAEDRVLGCEVLSVRAHRPLLDGARRVRRVSG